ncbi:MAG: peptide deformylase [Emergencia sp.]|nr:peptide deformylase [Emergencia sp.]
MAIRNIVTEGDDILRKHCREVGDITERIRVTMEDMLETMHKEQGCGIAAPQVGIMRRMFIAEPEPGRVYFMINPQMLHQEGTQVGDEGCLSVPGYIGTVERPEKIKIKALNLDGEEQIYDFEGWDAVVMCHEYDHLDGILYTDKATNVRIPEEEGQE